MRDFIFHASYLESIRELPAKDRLKAYEAICVYGTAGIELEGLKGGPKIILNMAKPIIDSEQQRRETNIKNGQAGGRPKKQTKTVADVTNKPNENQNETNGFLNQKPNQNLNKDKDKDKDKDNNTDKDNNMSGFLNLKPPTVEMLQNYIKTNMLSVDANSFFNYYNQRKWLVNGNVFNWQDKLREWHSRNSKSNRVLPEYHQSQDECSEEERAALVEKLQTTFEETNHDSY